MSRRPSITAEDMEIALKVQPDLVVTVALAKDLMQKRADLHRVEALHLATGRHVRLYLTAQNRERDCANALQQHLSRMTLPEIPYP